jgi:hypothetical protein
MSLTITREQYIELINVQIEIRQKEIDLLIRMRDNPRQYDEYLEFRKLMR